MLRGFNGLVLVSPAAQTSMSYYYTSIFENYRPKPLDITGPFFELLSNFNDTKLLVCGESHGVCENADIAYTLCKRLGIKHLAIERPRHNFEQFIQSALNDQPDFSIPQVIPSLQASMLSIEMLKTIATLVNEEQLNTIEYIDLDPESSPRLSKLDNKEYMLVRERQIGQNLLEVNTKTPTMAILGNYHTRLNINHKQGQSSLQLVRQFRKVTYLKYEYLSGAQYNAGRLLRFPNRLSNKTIQQKTSYNLLKLSDSNFVIEVPQAHQIHV